jgi:hypothetical protein
LKNLSKAVTEFSANIPAGKFRENLNAIFDFLLPGIETFSKQIPENQISFPRNFTPFSEFATQNNLKLLAIFIRFSHFFSEFVKTCDAEISWTLLVYSFLFTQKIPVQFFSGKFVSFREFYDEIAHELENSWKSFWDFAAKQRKFSETVFMELAEFAVDLSLKFGGIHSEILTEVLEEELSRNLLRREEFSAKKILTTKGNVSDCMGKGKKKLMLTF